MGLMGGCVRGESVVADDAPGTGGTLSVQLSLPLIRFPERIPAASERITDGVTGASASRTPRQRAMVAAKLANLGDGQRVTRQCPRFGQCHSVPVSRCRDTVYFR
jgi:hypothetical protein